MPGIPLSVFRRGTGKVFGRSPAAAAEPPVDLKPASDPTTGTPPPGSRKTLPMALTFARPPPPPAPPSPPAAAPPPRIALPLLSTFVSPCAGSKTCTPRSPRGFPSSPLLLLLPDESNTLLCPGVQVRRAVGASNIRAAPPAPLPALSPDMKKHVSGSSRKFFYEQKQTWAGMAVKKYISYIEVGP